MRDPWTWVIAGTAGGVAAAATLPLLPAAVPIALAVAGVKVALGALTGCRQGPPGGPPSTAEADLPVVPGSAAAFLLGRAERAAADYRDLAQGLRGGALAQSTAGVGQGVDDTVRELRAVAGRACLVDGVLGRLTGAAASRAGPANERARQAAQERTAAVTRIAAHRQRLLEEMETAALELEEIVARVGELVTQVAAGDEGDAGPRLDDLAGSLDGLRAGLAETADVTRRTLAREPTG